LCHSDLYLISGDWKKSVPLQLPKIPGYEIACWIKEIDNSDSKGLVKNP
jgi:propanol-preferring alcohol dehydrogenase